ncbi:MAG: hypothetical protein ACK45I_00290 [Bacteroidota bacterium]|jgi:hypothetical protein
MAEEKLTLVTKRKHTNTVFDYCLDNRISFTVNPKGISADEFCIDLTINGIKQAVALGMFAKEHKFEVLGFTETASPKTNTNVSKKQELKENPVVENHTSKVDQQPTSSVLQF